MKRIQIVPVLCLAAAMVLIGTKAFGQAVTVTGTVTDAVDGQSLPGANIIVKGTATGTATGLDGEYELLVPSLQDTLVISFVGYLYTEVPIDGRTTIDIALQPDVVLGEEIVVVGYGTQRKETVTGSMTSVAATELRQAPVANVSNALVGRVPGLVAVQASGEPGLDAATIRIRGASTLNSSGQNPLIVIDGTEKDFQTLNALDVNEIESINILKDASATAVYGVKGANGVIIVKTKRGRAGAPQITFSSNMGFTQMAFPLEMLGSYEYALYRNEAIMRDGDPAAERYLFTETDLWKFKNNRDYTPEEVDAMTHLTAEQKAALKDSPALYYSSHDWFKEQFGRAGPQHQYNLNLSGGSERVRYFTSVGYFSQTGAIANADYGGGNANSQYDRYNFRSNIDIDATDNVQIQVNLAGQTGDFRGILGKDGDITSQFSRNKEMTVVLLQSPPYSGPGIIDGRLVTGFVANSSPLQEKGGSGYSPTVYVLEADYMERLTNSLNASAQVRHQMDYLTRGLSVQGTVSYDNRYMRAKQIFPDIPTYTAMRNPENPVEILYFGGRTGPYSVNDDFRRSKWRRFYVEGALNYNREFGSHTLTGLALAHGQRTFDPGLRYRVPAGLVGVVGRLTYEFDSRYLAEFNMGYNGSENFPEKKRFGFFPAVSAGWNISNESFFPKNDWITWLKIRGSYGEVGNDQIGGTRFLYLPSTWGYTGNYPSGGYYFGDTDGGAKDPYYQGVSEADVGNPDVTWERAKKSNIGLEMRFFRDRLTVTTDLFQEKRDNILWRLGTIPDLVGTDLPPANLGKVSNHGYEISAEWFDRIGSVGYRLQGNLSFARNKIEYMDEPAYPYEWMNRTGFSLGQYRGYYNSGFFNSAREANNRPFIGVDGNKVQAGDLRYIDIDGDGILDINDQVPVGYANLPQYAFSWVLGLNYKGFDVSALFVGSANGSFPYADFGALEDSPLVNPFSRGNWGAMKWQYEGRWTPEKVEQGIEPEFPRASMRVPYTVNGVASSFWVRSSDFVRLKTVEVSYTLTSLRALQWANLNSIRIYVNGNNLYTFGSHVIDPEQEQAGAVTRGYLYPITRTFNFGVTLQF